jgi:uncharacterized protein (TIGR02246 family)
LERLEQLVKTMETAWNAGDHHAWASVFAPDAHFVNIFGAYRQGRDKIEDSHRAIFNGIYKDSHNEFTIEQVRELGPGLHTLLVFTRLVHKDGGHDGRMTMIVSESSGAPQILWFHNCFVTIPKHRASQSDAVPANPDRDGAQTPRVS